MKRTAIATAAATVITTIVLGGTALASSHREAPFIALLPAVDATDFYMFRSWEQNRNPYLVLIANYFPLQQSYGGPNYFSLDSRAFYDINIDNDGDAVSDFTFRFRFHSYYRDISVPVGGVDVAVPLDNVGPFRKSSSPALNKIETYTVDIIRANGSVVHGINMQTGGVMFIKPHDNIGAKSIPAYAQYAAQYVTPINFGTCSGRVFVGQRNDGFSVNLGEVFDLINTNPVGPPNGERNILADSNVTSISMEIPATCVRQSGDQPIIGAWTTSTIPLNNQYVQVSRLGAPLVNEIVIGLPDKDKFNGSQPKDDGQFAKYVTNPTLPALIQALFPSVTAPTTFPRTDLVAAFLTGIAGLNKPVGVKPSEMLRLNTSIQPNPAFKQKNLGVLAGDLAGFPNGRRPGDDVVDIELRVAMGVLLTDAEAPSRTLPYTDGATVQATDFSNMFPFLNTPIPGSPSN